jgi:hypothetical protein
LLSVEVMRERVSYDAECPFRPYGLLR